MIEALRLSGEHQIVGLLDLKEEMWHTDVLDVPVLGDDSLLPELFQKGVCLAFIGLAGTGYNGPRRRLYELASDQGFRAIQVIHPHASISPSALLGEGLTVMACAVINAEATFGVNVIVNTGAIVEHDCLIGNHVHVATGAKLAANVRIAEGAHIGVGASVRQGISIGAGAIVGAGAAVVKDVDPKTVVAGVPARVLKHLDRTPL
jgi:UDP-perosamine 4-acetyltransferase